MNTRSDVGLYGLAVMGRNLALNILGHGYSLAVYNDNSERAKELAAHGSSAYPGFSLADTPKDLVASLARPRRLFIMAEAGKCVDEAIDSLLPYLESGDILIDGGNSHYKDTERRGDMLAPKGLHFVGMGVSGDEDGAHKGLSLMPGCDEDVWIELRVLLDAIAAKTAEGVPCTSWMGRGGSGHFVKMVHNSLEYADIELISETYHLLRSFVRMSHDEMRTVFSEWNRGELSSYLIAITADILGVRDEDGEPLLEKVLDRAVQKGTGAWACQAALELGVPVGLLAEAVFARSLSSLKDERVGASAVLGGPKAGSTGERHSIVEDLRKALLAAKVVSYAEGFLLLRKASAEYGWNTDPGKVALAWREGCNIRSGLLDPIAEAFRKEDSLSALILDSHFKAILDQCLPSLRKVTVRAIEQGTPVPAFAAALSFYDGYRATWLPANLVQALRDRFGAHGYERIDRPRGESFHSDWK